MFVLLEPHRSLPALVSPPADLQRPPLSQMLNLSCFLSHSSSQPNNVSKIILTVHRSYFAQCTPTLFFGFVVLFTGLTPRHYDGRIQQVETDTSSPNQEASWPKGHTGCFHHRPTCMDSNSDSFKTDIYIASWCFGYCEWQLFFDFTWKNLLRIFNRYSSMIWYWSLSKGLILNIIKKSCTYVLFIFSKNNSCLSQRVQLFWKN